MLDIIFGSAGDDDLSTEHVLRVGQNFQEYWTAPVIATFVECINDKDESVRWVARKVVDEVKEERVVHRLGCQIWVGAKMVCDNAPKRGKTPAILLMRSEGYSWARLNWVIPLTEKDPARSIRL